MRQNLAQNRSFGTHFHCPTRSSCIPLFNAERDVECVVWNGLSSGSIPGAGEQLRWNPPLFWRVDTRHQFVWYTLSNCTIILYMFHSRKVGKARSKRG